MKKRRNTGEKMRRLLVLSRALLIAVIFGPLIYLVPTFCVFYAEGQLTMNAILDNAIFAYLMNARKWGQPKKNNIEHVSGSFDGRGTGHGARKRGQGKAEKGSVKENQY